MQNLKHSLHHKYISSSPYVVYNIIFILLLITNYSLHEISVTLPEQEKRDVIETILPKTKVRPRPQVRRARPTNTVMQTL